MSPWRHPGSTRLDDGLELCRTRELEIASNTLRLLVRLGLSLVDAKSLLGTLLGVAKVGIHPGSLPEVLKAIGWAMDVFGGRTSGRVEDDHVL